MATNGTRKIPQPSCRECGGNGKTGLCGPIVFGFCTRDCDCLGDAPPARQNAADVWGAKLDLVSNSLLRMMQETAVTQGLISLVTDHVYNTFSDDTNFTQRSYAVLTKLRWMEPEAQTGLASRQAKALSELCYLLHQIMKSEITRVRSADHPLLVATEEAWGECSKLLAAAQVPPSDTTCEEIDEDAVTLAQANVEKGRVQSIKLLAQIHKLLSCRAVRLGCSSFHHTSQLPDRLSNAWMGLSTASDSDKRKIKVAFVGAESIGKSTLINFTVDSNGNGDDFMPTGEGMVTETLCIVRNGQFASLSASDEPAGGPMNLVQMREKIRAESVQISKKRQENSKDLTNLKFFKAQRSWVGEAANVTDVELIDVPGYKPTTKTETYLALGIAQKLILCAGPKEHLEDSLDSGGDLEDIPRIFSDVAKAQGLKNIPIILAVTKVSLADFNRDKQAYIKIVQKFFDVPEVDIVWANCYECHKNSDQITLQGCIGDLMIKIHGDDSDADLRKSPMSILEDLKVAVVGEIDQEEERVNDMMMSSCDADDRYREKKDVVFLKSLKEVIGKLAKQCKLDKTQRDELKNHLERVKPKAEDIPLFTAMHGGEVTQHVVGGPQTAENLVLESRIAFLSVVTTMTDKVFGDMWASFSAFNEKQDKAVDLFCDCLEFTSTSRDWSKLESVDAWDQACGHYLSCCRPRDFGWFVAGYYLACIDEKLKRQFMYGFAGKADQQKEFKKEDVVQFPAIEPADPTRTGKAKPLQRVIEDFENTIQKQKNDLDKTLKSSGIDAFLEKQLRCIMESATVVKSNLKRSTVFKTENPFVAKLVEFAKGMLQRIFIKWEVHGEQSNFRFSEFKTWLEKARSNGPLRYVTNALLDLGEKAGSLTQREKFALMGSGVAVVAAEVESGEVTDSVAGIHNELVKQMEVARSNSASDGESASDVFVLWTSSKTTPAQGLLDNLQQKFKDEGFGNVKFQTGLANQKDAMKTLVPQVYREKPLIVLVLRRHDQGSATLKNAEEELHNQLLESPGIGAVVWVTSSDNKVKANLTTHVCPVEVGAVYDPDTLLRTGADAIPKYVTELAGKARAAAIERTSTKKAAFETSQNRIMELLRKYKKSKTIDISPEGLRSVMEESFDEGKKTLVDLSTGEFDLHLPKFELLRDARFVDKALLEVGGQKPQAVQELKIRSFLNKIIVGQIVEHAEKVAALVFDRVVAELLSKVAAAFKLRSDEMLWFIERFHNETLKGLEKEKKKGAKVDPKHDKRLSEAANILNTAAFLRKQSFVYMYVGGTVMALMPLLTGIVLPQLCVSNGDALPTPALSDYKAKKANAIAAIEAMRLDENANN